LTDLQREVYRGRTMGCVNCGRPIHVDAAIAAQFPVVTAGAEVGSGGPMAGADAADATGGPSQSAEAPAADPAPTLTPTGGPSSPASAARLRPNTATVVSLTAGIVFVVLLGMAAIAGYVAADAGTDAGGDVVTYVLLASGAAAGVVAILCGWLGLVRSRRPLVGGRSAATFGLGLGAAGLLVGGCVMSTILPNLHRARDRAERDACLNNLQQIATAIGSYASGDSAHRYPDSLDTLVRGGMLSPNLLLCPAAKPQPSASTTTAPSATFPSAYVYVGAGRSSTSVGLTDVLAYEQPGDHRGGVHVLFADGVIGFCPNPQATQMIRELQSGQNPAPSAVAARQ
jgi:prepilin-type processing-associated H-X9-DG protein